MTRRFATLLLVLLLATSLPAAIVGGTIDAPDDPAKSIDESAAGASQDGTPFAEVAGVESRSTGAIGSSRTVDLAQRTVLRARPDEPNEIGADVSYEIPDEIEELQVTLPDEAAVESTEGFDRADDGTYEWTGETATPRIAFAMPVDRTGEGHRAIDVDGAVDRSSGVDGSANRSIGSADGSTAGSRSTVQDEGYFFVDAGDWAIVRVPQTSLEWSATRSVAVDRSVEVDGPGATGGDVAFLGEVTEYTRETREETIRLVVPDAADLREDPEAILDALADASETLRVGATSEEVFVVAAPTGEVEWGARGVQYGSADAWVRDDARLDEASNVWLHEYVHTRQEFTRSDGEPTTETAWIVEAQAEYYAALLGLRQGSIEYREFRRHLEAGTESPYAEGVLADPGTWRDSRTDYVKGPLVVGALDREIRLETEGERTLQDVFRRVNLREEPLTAAALSDVVEDRSGPEARRFLERYASADEAPSAWDSVEHREAFDQETAIFDYRLADDALAIEGPYRNESVDDGPVIVPRERLTVAVDVENVGDRDGEYEAILQVDGELVDAATGRLESSAVADERLVWSPTEPGRYELRAGGDRLTVRVVDPADVTVADLTVDPETVSPGESIGVTATVENDAEVPAEAIVEVRTPEGVVDEREVRLAPGESATLESSTSFDRPGRYEIAVGDRVAEVTVERESDADATEVVDELAGFGVAPALCAVVLALALVVRHRR